MTLRKLRPSASLLLLLLLLLFLHLLGAKSLSQEECQSEPRLSFHLSFLPLTEGGEKRRRRRRRKERSYIINTHTHAGIIRLWKLCGSGGKSVHCASSTLSFWVSLAVLGLFAFICPHLSSFEDVFVGSLLSLLVRTAFCSSCSSISYLLTSTRCFDFPSLLFNTEASSPLDHQGHIFHFYKCTFLFIDSFSQDHRCI
ncbi:hypothetical protein ILYODFUR_016773 [Ilyodon furcidens]|uniref:Uncharacterized protein n=1 Tax=Ilyodon furcidens TaxID=33524 RepID=A0ABV0V3N7_9TELE